MGLVVFCSSRNIKEFAGVMDNSGNKRDTAKRVTSAGNIIEQAGSTGSNSRLNRSVSDHGRLPDSVQQARERLLQRLNSVDLSGRRQNTSSSETIRAGVAPGVSTTSDSIFGSLTSCFHADVTIAPCKLQASTAESFNIEDEHTLITHCSEPAATQEEVASCKGTDGDELAGPSVECSICLERCGDADGLIELRCKHIFHSACLEQWLRSRSDCPYCRARVLLTAE
uniref:RING-type domain-containing protein n=1 Tax=Oryza brachyantha TaxID=4533 RepID=J3NEI0_ORYBR